MARIRSVHPSLFTDESWVSCSPLARILYVGLWTDADDQGLFEWKPLQIKMRLLPGDAGDVAAMLAEMEDCDLIRSYEVGGKRFGAIGNFRKFQRPQKPNAIHPLPDHLAAYVGISSTGTEQVSDQSATPTGEDKPMEDGGCRGQDTEASLPVAPVDATGPEKPLSQVAAKHPSETDAAFGAVWDAATPEMRRRGKSRAKVWPEWLKARRNADPADILVAMGRYIREDPDVKRTGGPGLHIWLRDGTYALWSAEGTGGSVGPVWCGPGSVRAELLAEKGEGFVRSYLDPCGWDEAGGLILTRTAFAATKLTQESGHILRRLNLRAAHQMEQAA